VAPWIGYYASLDGEFVGSGGFKGRPIEGKVEIAYGTFPTFQNRGIGTLICRELVDVALATDPTVKVMARTLMEENYSTKILKKNGFVFRGVVTDPDDGDVWEWQYLQR
jgi:RimJ/RimL family protein N-acetyltransferase